jgi:hypothetical protein
MITRREVLKSAALGLVSIGIPRVAFEADARAADRLAADFLQPPDTARPWVYWYFMDGNLTREGMTADLEALKKAGVGGAIYLEVGIGVEPGPVKFMSDPWQELLGHAFLEADRLRLQIALAAGPGWCGTGGPWVKPEQSMQHLVSSETTVHGPATFDALLPRPQPRTPFFGEATLSPELHKLWKEFYLDVVVLAFPTPAEGARIADVDEKALYTRGSYSSQIPGPYSSLPSVRPFFHAAADFIALPAAQCVASDQIIDLTDKFTTGGRLVWDVPPGEWTIMRFGRTITGQTTRPAPAPGLGLESDKFDQTAIDTHFDAYIGSLLKKTGNPKHHGRGLTTLHFDSWEMSSQNWSGRFREEFTHRRGYDPVRFLPTFGGHVVDNSEISERFLWDVRQTGQELVVEKHVTRLCQLGQRYGLQLSLEPYDLSPCADLTLGSIADVPMGEFWSKGWDVKTDFSIVEAASLGHTLGRPIIGAEAFTADKGENGQQYPGSMKAQGDWAFCAGMNRFVIHRYQAQPWMNRYPGMMMGTDGGYGVEWQRTQTWWDMAWAYHLYLSRCQQMLRRGLFVADILYLALEGAPNIFLPPRSAMRVGEMRDRLGYNFDGCAPGTFIERASVKEGRIVFPDGMSYRLLVLPRSETMTPQLLEKILQLVEDGATVIGAPPRKSPSLENHPQCDEQVKKLARKLWGREGDTTHSRKVGKGRVIYDAEATPAENNPLALAQWIWFPEGSVATPPAVGKRYFHRSFQVDAGQKLQSAQVTMTADCSFEFYVNGQSLGGADTHSLWTKDVSDLLKAGENTLTVTAKNGGNPLPRGGLVGMLSIRFVDGSSIVLYTDSQWGSSRTKHGAFVAAAELGAAGTSPWNLDESAFAEYEAYPHYSKTAEVLSGMGVPPDFEGGESVRYIHRRNGAEDLYFVANSENRIEATTCRFRVGGRQPEWWDPLTGASRDLPEFTEEDGFTTVPLRLEAFESGFVVFRRPSGSARKSGRNFPELTTVITLTEPWEVSFDPKWGGPEKVQFASLEDWTKREEPGIKYYSGNAVYQTSFDLPTAATEVAHYLSFGKVKNLASVKLNGRELGIVWCDPWRVVIPAGVLQKQNNTLQIVVVNLWINRLIRDSGLPPQERLTWATSNPWHPDSPLQESGLLGPVAIQKVGDAETL